MSKMATVSRRNCFAFCGGLTIRTSPGFRAKHQTPKAFVCAMGPDSGRDEAAYQAFDKLLGKGGVSKKKISVPESAQPSASREAERRAQSKETYDAFDAALRGEKSSGSSEQQDVELGDGDNGTTPMLGANPPTRGQAKTTPWNAEEITAAYSKLADLLDGKKPNEKPRLRPTPSPISSGTGSTEPVLPIRLSPPVRPGSRGPSPASKAEASQALQPRQPSQPPQPLPSLIPKPSRPSSGDDSEASGTDIRSSTSQPVEMDTTPWTKERVSDAYEALDKYFLDKPKRGGDTKPHTTDQILETPTPLPPPVRPVSKRQVSTNTQGDSSTEPFAIHGEATGQVRPRNTSAGRSVEDSRSSSETVPRLSSKPMRESDSVMRGGSETVPDTKSGAPTLDMNVNDDTVVSQGDSMESSDNVKRPGEGNRFTAARPRTDSEGNFVSHSARSRLQISPGEGLCKTEATPSPLPKIAQKPERTSVRQVSQSNSQGSISLRETRRRESKGFPAFTLKKRWEALPVMELKEPRLIVGRENVKELVD